MPGEEPCVTISPVRADFDDVAWSDDSKQLVFVSTSRDHQEAHVRMADCETGEVRDIFEEIVDTQFESGQGTINWKYPFRYQGDHLVFGTKRLGTSISIRCRIRQSEASHYPGRVCGAASAKDRPGETYYLFHGQRRKRKEIPTSSIFTGWISVVRICSY